MCGFAGFLSFQSGRLDAPSRRAILQRMGDALAHRGPDEEQFYDDGVLSVVFRRLSLMDVAGGQQPIFNEDRGCFVLANGEIYNHSELRQSLSPRHRFSTASDSEVLLHAYEEWGFGAFERARGMFAAALWDRRSRRLVLARDRLGIKPLYVCNTSEGFLFGSELKALLQHPACPRDVDFSALEFDPIAPHPTPTYLRGVEYLPAGSYRVATPEGALPSRLYWSLVPSLGCAPFGDDAGAYVDALHDLLEASVKEHLQGESAAALHLSGGLDSAMLAALAARHAPELPCFSIVERTTLMVGDVEAARRTAQSLGLEWFPILFDYRTLLDELGFNLASLESRVWSMDSPRFDLEWMLKAELTQALRQQRPDIKVLLLGQGADEFAGGYSNRADAPRSSWAKYVSDEIYPLLHAYGGHAGHAGDALLATDLRIGGGQAGDWQSQQGPYHQAMLLFLRQLQHHNLWHEDRTSAAQGMEARVPFLDHRIVELLASVPTSLHETLFWNKRILRQCMQRILPDYDIRRPKVGFLSTADTRSIDMIAHTMATRLIREFLDSYLPECTPAERADIASLARRVLKREPGFYGASYDLLGRMCAAIFRRHCREASCQPLVAGRACLAPVSPSEWPGLLEQLAAEPVIRRVWHRSDRFALPAGGVIQQQCGEGWGRYSLFIGGNACSEFRLHHPPAWLGTLLVGLHQCDGGMRVAEATEAFGIPLQELSQMLDWLNQCGLIVLLSIESPLPEVVEG